MSTNQPMTPGQAATAVQDVLQKIQSKYHFTYEESARIAQAAITASGRDKLEAERDTAIKEVARLSRELGSSDAFQGKLVEALESVTYALERMPCISSSHLAFKDGAIKLARAALAEAQPKPEKCPNLLCEDGRVPNTLFDKSGWDFCPTCKGTGVRP